MLHSTHTFNHLVLTNMYQLQYNLNKVKHDRTSHIWLNQTFCSGFHHEDLTRKYQYCTYFKLRRKFKDLWSVQSEHFCLALQILLLKITKHWLLRSLHQHKMHISTMFCMVLTLLSPTSYPSLVLVNLSNTYKPQTVDKVLCVIEEISFLHWLQQGSNTPGWQGTSGQHMSSPTTSVTQHPAQPPSGTEIWENIPR